MRHQGIDEKIILKQMEDNGYIYFIQGADQ